MISSGSTKRIYVGTYTIRGSEGIYSVLLDTDSGSLEMEGLRAEITNPTFLIRHPSLPVIYACSTVVEGGALYTYNFDAESGALSLIDKRSAHGSKPVYASIGGAQHTLTLANFGDGNVTAYPLQSSGTPGNPAQVFEFCGSSVHPIRQTSQHAHSIAWDRTGQFAVMADLGRDKVLVFRDERAGQLEQVFEADTSAGFGPRHISFHPDNNHVAIVGEMGSGVIVYTLNKENGALQELCKLSTLPDDFTDKSACSEIAYSSSGKYLYAANRGHDSIVTCEVDTTTGVPAVSDFTKSGGRSPRHFAIDPSGKLMVVANENGDNLVSFFINPATGQLTATGYSLNVPSPSCILFP